MKDKIKVTLGKDHIWKSSNRVISRSGEHKVTEIEITLDESLFDFWVYLKFTLPNGETFLTEKLDREGNVVTYDIVNGLVAESGILKVQAMLKKETGESWESTIKPYIVEESINAVDSVPEKEDFLIEVQKTLDHLNSIEEGKSATIIVGEVETLEAGELAYVENVGDETDVILKFGIPKGEDGTGGSGGTSDYEKLKNLPSINDIELKGNKTLEQLGIQPKGNYLTSIPSEYITETELNNRDYSSKDYVNNAIIKDFKDISYNQDTATFVFTRHDNTIFTVDLPIEQTVKDGRYDETTNELVLVLVSGQEIKIPVTGLIDDYDGLDSATIQCVVSADNKIICNIIGGSISKTLLTTELQEEINNKLNINLIEEKQILITYEDTTTETVKLVVYK